MQYQSIDPPEQLRQFVKCFWTFEGNQEAKPYMYHSLADGCAERIFHYKGLFNETDVNGHPFYAALAAQTSAYKRFITHDARREASDWAQPAQSGIPNSFAHTLFSYCSCSR